MTFDINSTHCYRNTSTITALSILTNEPPSTCHVRQNSMDIYWMRSQKARVLQSPLSLQSCRCGLPGSARTLSNAQATMGTPALTESPVILVLVGHTRVDGVASSISPCNAFKAQENGQQPLYHGLQQCIVQVRPSESRL